MGASVLAADEEKKLAAQPNAEFAECKRGCPQMVVVSAGKFMMGTAGPLPTSCGEFSLILHLLASKQALADGVLDGQGDLTKLKMPSGRAAMIERMRAMMQMPAPRIMGPM